MKDTWYGDHRDLVKWGTLVHLARRERVGRIVQVAFLRRGERPPLETARGEVEIPEEVWAHFRDLTSVRGLGRSTGLEIETLTRPFEGEPRASYGRWAADRLRSDRENKVVLLDPDTGMEPQEARREHVKAAEVRSLWAALVPGDWLVLYQHRWRDVAWRETASEKFRRACGIDSVEVFAAEGVASDVALFAAKKA